MATVRPVLHRTTIARLFSILALAATLSACGGVAPEVGAGSDPELFDGREIWIRQCASCHGASGGGARGPKLSEGRVLERFPDQASQDTLVLEGRGGMPSYAGRLSESEISAVNRYIREVLTIAE